ncbi:MAG TPA: SET domain-containing protein [Ferruginibacter sp.]|nr:SET domain-containing protein [Ferruginibacter sp.]HMP22436.1 SET domain-containing protein [Ferruginibacter sp.]
MQLPLLFIAATQTMGRGVFTQQKIAPETIVEIAPVIVMNDNDRQHLDKTKLHDYIFEWGKNREQCCMALGYIPIYNHSYRSNCEYFMDFETETIMVKTVREILPGEELTINYNGDWDDDKKLWFEAL